MRIGLKPGVWIQRLHTLSFHDQIPQDLAQDWMNWGRSVKPTLSINVHGWSIKAGARELICEDGEVMGDPWLYFWLTGDATRMIPLPECNLSDLIQELDCAPLEALP